MIKKISVLYNGFQIDFSDEENKSHLLQFHDRILKKWDPHEIIKKIALHMHKHENSSDPDDRVYKGAELKDALNIKEDTFKKRVYQYFWYQLSAVPRISKKSVFHLWSKDIESDKWINETDEPTRQNLMKQLIRKKGKRHSSSSKYWLGDKKKTRIIVKDEISIEEILAERLDDKRIHPRFLKKTDELGLEDLEDEKAFDIFEAAEINPNYIPKIEENIDGELSQFIKEGKSVLVRGPSGTGKTRYVFNELKQTAGYYMFTIKNSIVYKAGSIIFSYKFKTLKNKKVIWLIDDLQDFNHRIKELDDFYQDLIDEIGRFIIVATIRSGLDNRDQSHIRYKLNTPIEMDFWHDKDMENLALAYGKSTENLPGNPFDFFKNLQRLKDLFCFYRENNEDCLWLLRYLKLLKSFLKDIDYNLIKVTYRSLREERQRTDQFNTAYYTLIHESFIGKGQKYIKTWDPILDKVVKYEDPSDMKNGLNRLKDILLKSKRIYELHELSFDYYTRDEFDDAIEIIETIPNESVDEFSASTLYHDYANSLYHKAIQNSDYTLLRKALKYIKKAIEYKDGGDLSLELFGIIQMELGDHMNAIKTLKKALKKDPEHLEASYLLGRCLYKLERYEEACNCLEKLLIWSYFNEIYSYLEKTQLDHSNKTDKMKAKIFIKAYIFTRTKLYLKFLKSHVIQKANNKKSNKSIKRKEKRKKITDFISIDPFILENYEDIYLIFKSALSIIFKTNELNDNTLKKLKNSRKRVAMFGSFVQLVDAIIKNKEPEKKEKQTSTDFLFSAAIIFAEEIVALRSSN